MLPPSLVSVYQQYKEDTNAVASWLASTAKSRGYPADLLSGASSQTTVPEPSKRLKGKARKQAKAAAQQQKDSPSNSSKPDYIIAIKDFIPLAEFVAASKKPVVSVPLSFANTLNRVISTRSGFRTRLAELNDSPDVSADSMHSHFVGVLEKVREVLTPRFSPATRDAAKTLSPSDPVGEVGGRFAGLRVDEPSEEFLNAPDIERPVPVKNDNATYVAEPQQELFEVLFAYHLMIKDLAMIRARIEWIWITYRDNDLELVAAAIATNTACDLARNLMGDMAPMFEEHGGAIEIAFVFYLVRCLGEGFSRHDIIDFDENESTYQTYDIATDTYLVAFKLIKRFLDNLDPDRLPVYKDGTEGTYDPTRDWSRMSNQEKFHQDYILVMEIFTEIAIVARCLPTYPVFDELIRGLQELDRTREIPMYFAFAVQILLDIHHVLRGRVYSAHETCMSHLRLMDEDLSLHQDFAANLRTKRSVAHIDVAIKELRKNIKWVQEDNIRKVKVHLLSRSGIECTAPTHRLLRYSPVISGLMLYKFRATMNGVGVSVANSWGAITFSMHLWNALKQEDLLSPREAPHESWHDMVAAATLLGRDSFFVGSDLPEKSETYIKNLCLQMGMTVAAFSNSKDKRLPKLERLISKTRTRFIKHDCAPVLHMFFDRYVRNTGQVDWTPEHVDRVLSRSLHEEEVSEDDSSFILSQITDPEKLRERKKNIALETSGKKTTAARMPPEELIKSLALVLQIESLTMAFPYLTMHRAAWGVLCAVREACEPVLVEVYGPESTTDDKFLPTVVFCIFTSLVEGDDRLFVKAGEVVRDQLRQRQGIKTLQRLQEMGFTVLGEHAAGSTRPKVSAFFIL